MNELWTGIFVPLIAAVIGAVGGGIGSYVVAKKQLKAEFQKFRSAAIQRKAEKLEQLSSEIGRIRFPAIDNLTDEQILSKRVDHFQEMVKIAKPYLHYFPDSITDELQSVSNGVNQFIFDAKMSREIDEVESRKLIDRLSKVDKLFNQELATSLSRWQAELEHAVSMG